MLKVNVVKLFASRGFNFASVIGIPGLGPYIAELILNIDWLEGQKEWQNVSALFLAEAVWCITLTKRVPGSIPLRVKMVKRIQNGLSD